MIHFVSDSLFIPVSQRFTDVTGLRVIHFAPSDWASCDSLFTTGLVTIHFSPLHNTVHGSLTSLDFMWFTGVAGVSRILKEHYGSVCIAGSGVGGGRAEDDRRFFAVPTTAWENRRDQPIDLSSLSRLGKSCTRQIRPSFPTCTAFHSRGNRVE